MRSEGSRFTNTIQAAGHGPGCCSGAHTQRCVYTCMRVRLPWVPLSGPLAPSGAACDGHFASNSACDQRQVQLVPLYDIRPGTAAVLRVLRTEPGSVAKSSRLEPAVPSPSQSHSGIHLPISTNFSFFLIELSVIPFAH